MEEIWKPIKFYEGIYEVNNSGEIRTAAGKTTTSDLHGVRKWKQRVLKQKRDKNGYKRVTLWKDKTKKDFLVHRLVAGAFTPMVVGKDYINHKDGNPGNNNVSNLEWCNHQENLLHAFENRLNQNPDPVILYNKKTRQMSFFYSKSKASEFLGRSKGYVSNVLKQGKTSVGHYEIYIRPSEKEV